MSTCIRSSKTNTICSYFGELFNKSRDHSWFLTPKDVRWFFHVVRLWKAIKKLGPLVSSRLSFVVSNGQRVSFWKDKWCGTTPLCDSFPSLFALATPKEAWVKDVWIVSQSREMGGVAALPRFSRPFNDWEMDEVERLLLCLCGKRVNLDEEDRVQ